MFRMILSLKFDCVHQPLIANCTLIILDKSLIFTVIALEGPAEPRSEPHARALGAPHGYRLELVRAAHGERTAPATGKRFHVILLLATTTECLVIYVANINIIIIVCCIIIVHSQTTPLVMQ